MRIEISEEMIDILRHAVVAAQNACEYTAEFNELEEAYHFLLEIEEVD